MISYQDIKTQVLLLNKEKQFVKIQLSFHYFCKADTKVDYIFITEIKILNIMF